MMRRLLILLAVLLSSPLSADSPGAPTTAEAGAPGFDGAKALTWSASAGTISLMRPGRDRSPVAFSRVQGALGLPADFGLVLRVEVSAQGDAADETKPTWTAVEWVGGAFRTLTPGLALVGVYGESYPLERGVEAEVRVPRLYGGGLLLGSPRERRWLLLAGGRHDAAPGARVLFAGSWPMAGNVHAVADGAVGGAHTFVRAGVAISTGGSK